MAYRIRDWIFGHGNSLATLPCSSTYNAFKKRKGKKERKILVPAGVSFNVNNL